MTSFSTYCVFIFVWITLATISFVRCSGEGTNQNSNPAAAVVSPSSSTEWINNVLINSPSVSHNSIPVHNEAHENRVASPQSTANSFGRVDDATAVSSNNHQSIRKSTLDTLPYTQEIPLDSSSTLKPLRKYSYKEGTRKSKEANWIIHDHERWLRHTTKKAIKRRMERKGFKADKESDTDRIRFNIKRLKENNPFKYTKELHDASIWKHNKNAPIHGRRFIKKFEQIQPEPTMKELEEAHLEHRLHKCLGRRERYNAVRKQKCTSNNPNL